MDAPAPLASLADLCAAPVSPAERAAAVRPLADTLGVMLAGLADPRAADLAATLGLSAAPGRARLPGSALHGAASDVALMAGFAAHLLDFDDDETEVAMAHLSAPVLGAALALASRAETPVAMLLDGYVTGCRMMLALGSMANPALYRAGWHATSALGSFGAAAASARLLGLSPARAAEALGLAASGAGGPRGAFGGEGKPLQVGLAAANGLRAAELAAAGWTAAPGALFGARGLLGRMTGGAIAPLRQPGAFPPPGFVTKLFPSCTATHAAVAELLALRPRMTAPPAEILCAVDPFVPAILIPGLPAGPDAARFSLAYCLAVAARTGALGPEAFEAAAFDADGPRDPEIRALMARVRVTADESLPRGPSGIATGAVVTLTAPDGTRLTGRREAAPGSAAAPLTDTQLAEKFAACLAPVARPSEARALWQRLLSPTDFPSAGALLDALPLALTDRKDPR
ncbi:MmgE/PrpD family protein [Cereibacter johrii]|uniref:MmgE/PrpD family protein n=1 Tax=Cereibacter johrii TaxID=445629 RepID=UPI002B25B64E|nr:MmgE/PrpD family protein [Cereibacter johrii]MEA5162837.1 MmgE/PrpD family protein [Cereibacter johrii]